MKLLKLALVTALAAGVLLQAADVSAGKPHDRTGFFVGFGVGAGTAGWNWSEEAGGGDEAEGSFVFDFRLGWAVKDNLVLGLENAAWAKRYEIEGTAVNATFSFNATTFAVTYFPANMGLYVKGGVGFGSTKGEINLGSNFNVAQSDPGVALLGAFGYEWRLTDKFALGPQVEAFYVKPDGEVFQSATVVDATVQLNWYW
jgi:opacity protein-like surface antigen